MLKLKDVVYENGQHWVHHVGPGDYAVYRVGVTHSTRCAQILWKSDPAKALRRAIEECNRREHNRLAASAIPDPGERRYSVVGKYAHLFNSRRTKGYTDLFLTDGPDLAGAQPFGTYATKKEAKEAAKNLGAKAWNY